MRAKLIVVAKAEILRQVDACEHEGHDLQIDTYPLHVAKLVDVILAEYEKAAWSTLSRSLYSGGVGDRA